MSAGTSAADGTGLLEHGLPVAREESSGPPWAAKPRPCPHALGFMAEERNLPQQTPARRVVCVLAGTVSSSLWFSLGGGHLRHSRETHLPVPSAVNKGQGCGVVSGAWARLGRGPAPLSPIAV